MDRFPKERIFGTRTLLPIVSLQIRWIEQARRSAKDLRKKASWKHKSNHQYVAIVQGSMIMLIIVGLCVERLLEYECLARTAQIIAICKSLFVPS